MRRLRPTYQFVEVLPWANARKAEAQFREVLTINPDSFDALLGLGNLMLRRGQREEASRFYEQARKQLENEEQAMRAVLTQPCPGQAQMK